MKLANGTPMPRAQEFTLASARRELWRKHHAMPATQLVRELLKHEFHMSDYGRLYRTDHMRSVSLWYIRMIETELRKRGCLAPVTHLHGSRNDQAPS
jgi:hypothetical protein